MEKLEAIKCSDQKLEIYLTDGDLEAIANGHEVVIPFTQRIGQSNKLVLDRL